MNEKLKNIKLVLQYDGKNYHGWQRQKNDITIQGLLEEKIEKMTGKPVTLYASGRTDAGVHALHQVCNFNSDTKIDPESLRNGLNSLLPDDIYIKEAEYVDSEFHSRYSAKRKSYEYRIWNMKERNIFLRDYTWHIAHDLDLQEIKRCLSMLVGKQDFSSFKSSGSGNINPVREMYKADLIDHNEEGMVCFFFEAEGFLRHMVRNIVGTVTDAGLGRITGNDFKEILRSGDRKKAGIKAPPQGLFLTMVKY
ncbi:tRNA pseudouridine(38-40) synthase TruA [Thermodesulfobacteriota bacterium]